VVVAMMTVMVMRLRERGGREHQHQGQNNQLLHAVIVARVDLPATVEIAAGTFPVSPSISNLSKTVERTESSVESEKRFVSSKEHRFPS
jgi:hypothetical protein